MFPRFNSCETFFTRVLKHFCEGKAYKRTSGYAQGIGGIMLSKSSFASLVPVRNMDRAIKFYTKTLGGSLNMRADGEMKNFWASVNVGKAEFWLVKPEKHEKRDLAYSTFVVKDIKQTVSQLKRKGVKFRRAERMGPDSRAEGPINYSPYGAAASFMDSEGNYSMLWENKIPFPK